MSIMQLTQTIHIMPSPQVRSRKRPVQQTLPGMELEMSTPPQVTNRQIAEVLSGIADLLETQNSNPYRIQAYRNAARGVLDLAEPAAQILARGEELPLAGVGDRLRAHINELVQMGTVTFQNGLLMQTLPQGVRALMAIEHIGPYTAIRLYEELDIDSPEKLLRAAQQQRIRQLTGFGTRSEARLQEAAQRLMKEKRPQRSLSVVA
ncbi:MAG: histidinol-phosphatase [Ktedonobacteraceae bacterium]|nr:histidinol-phosphatase [Ktedonobacteraceae bacterium]